MTENKRFYYDFEDPKGHKIIDRETGKHFKLETVGDYNLLTDMMSIMSDENEQLKSEINMLKVTIGRNEAYIKRLTEKSEWRC